LIGPIAFGSAVLFAIGGQLLLKMGLSEVGVLSPSSFFSTRVLQKLLLSKVGIGVLCYFASAGLYMVVLSREDVSRLYPLFSMTYLGVVGGASLFLGERFGVERLIGVILVMVGCYVIARY